MIASDANELNDFPVSAYYRDRIREARTISRTGSWWTAILLIQDPKTDLNFLAFYRWQKRGGEWKTRKSYTCRSKRDAQKMLLFIDELAKFLD